MTAQQPPALEDRTAATIGVPAPAATCGHRDAAEPPVGPATPLTAAYCAERAAAAVHSAEECDDPHRASTLLDCARHWRDLAEKMATHAPMTRRPDRDDRR